MGGLWKEAVAPPLGLVVGDHESPDVFVSLDEGKVGGPLAFLNGDDRGGFVGTKPSLLPGEAGAQITRNNLSWGTLGQAATVTYAFRATAPGTMPTDTTGFTQFNASQISGTLLALAAWSDVANIIFTRVDNGDGYSNTASMLFGNYASGQAGAGAFAYAPGERSATSNSGDIWLNATSTNLTLTQLFYGQHTVLHEIGHAIGLSHPAAYNASEGVSITYAANASYAEDSRQYSVMSYFNESNTGASFAVGGSNRYASAPLLDDISAAQRLYGANMTTLTGDTVYGFNSNAGRPWFIATGSVSTLIFCVWDAGGTDTLDFSGYAMAQTIDLRQASFSSVGGLVGNVSIASGAVIENAIGGSGNDTIRGNSADNRMTGGGGTDIIDGGLGSDTVVFQGPRSAYTITWNGGTGTITRAGESVTVTNVEFLAFTDQTIAASPTGGLTVSGDLIANTINGSAFADRLGGGGGADTLNGLDGADVLDGGWGDDQLFGGAGDDFLIGGLGADAINGGDGVDTVDYSAATSSVTISLTTGTASGAGGADTLNGVEIVRGSAFDDFLTGDEFDNALYGLGGIDTLRGMGGADTLIAGAPGQTGGAPDIDKTQAVINNSIDTAVSLDSAFDLLPRTGVADAQTIPHATVVARSHGGVEYYAFTVAAGATVTLDIDDTNFDSTLRLFNASGSELAKNDDNAGDGGSSVDSALTYTFPTAGTYYVQVGQWGANLADDFTTVAPAAGATYTLHVSVPNHAVAPIISSGSTLDGGEGADTLYGSTASDWLSGGGGDDVLIGGQGNDLLVGGTGADVFRFAAATDSFSSAFVANDVIDDFQTGIDRIDLSALTVSSVSIVQQGEYNLVTATTAGQTFSVRVRGPISNSDIQLGAMTSGQIYTGTNAAETIVGGAGNDTIIGLAGGDALAGGGGGDTFQYSAASDSTTSAYDNLYDFETGVDVVNLNTLTTSAISIIRSGGSSFLFANTTSGHLQIVAAGRTINGADVAYTASHGIYMVGSSVGENLIGGSRADGIFGDAGADILIGGVGADALGGGAGADVFRYTGAGDSTATAYDNLFDFETGIDSIDLTALATTAISVVRQGGSSFLFANTSTGDMQLLAAGQAINGADINYAGTHGLTLVGSSSSESLIGGSRADLLFGGGGSDFLSGGAGADVFRYLAASDSALSASDQISGFVSGTDRIELSGVRTGVSDRFGIAYADGGSFLFVDLGGDGNNDMLIQLGGTTLQVSDIIWGSAASPIEDVAKPAADDVPFAESLHAENDFWPESAPGISAGRNVNVLSEPGFETRYGW